MPLRLGSARAPRVVAGAPPENSRCDAAHQTVRSTGTPRRGAGDATREGAGATRATSRVAPTASFRLSEAEAERRAAQSKDPGDPMTC